MHALNTPTEKSKNQHPSRIRKKPHRIQISQTGNHSIPEKWVKKIGRFVLRKESWHGNGILSIVLVNDSEIQALNAQFLQRDCPTDVIAFPLGDSHDEMWGEIYISMDRVKEQANDYHVSLAEEFARLIIHGILHLIGYDDQTKLDRIEMKKKEDHYLNLFRCDGFDRFMNG